jgi:transposase
VKKFTRPVLRGGDDGNIIPLTRPWKKGQTYGTILVDLEKHRVIELLPDRCPDTVERWLRSHPEIEIVSRDRGGDYAAARKGAPQAQQVADRFHLVKNLREALRDLMERKQSCLPEAPEDDRTDAVPSKAQGRAKGIKYLEVESEPGQEKRYRIMSPYLRQSARQTTYEAVRTQVRRDNRSARYQAVRMLHQQGFSLREIARRLKISRQSVRRFVRAESFPERTKAPHKASILDPYKPYLLKRWQQGCWNGVQLFEEITVRGYTGSAPLLRRFLRELRTKQQEAGETGALTLDAAGTTIKLPSSLSPQPPIKNRMAPTRASWLFVSQPIKLDEKQRQQVQDIRAGHPDLEMAYDLSQRFVLMLTERRGSDLDAWLMQAKQSGIVELQRFATGIRRDYAAVRAAFSSPWSNGQVEAQVNCLKLQKRLMFGRAKFDLLRLRVLHAS